MKLLKGSVISILSMLLATVVLFKLSGIGNEVTLGATIFGTFAIPIVFLFWGLPAHLLLQKLNMPHYLWYVLVGSIPGPIIVTWLKHPGLEYSRYLNLDFFLSSLIGIVGAVSLWFYMVYKNS